MFLQVGIPMWYGGSAISKEQTDHGHPSPRLKGLIVLEQLSRPPSHTGSINRCLTPSRSRALPYCKSGNMQHQHTDSQDLRSADRVGHQIPSLFRIRYHRARFHGPGRGEENQPWGTPAGCRGCRCLWRLGFHWEMRTRD
jgi:hypothetical protein